MDKPKTKSPIKFEINPYDFVYDEMSVEIRRAVESIKDQIEDAAEVEIAKVAGNHLALITDSLDKIAIHCENTSGRLLKIIGILEKKK